MRSAKPRLAALAVLATAATSATAREQIQVSGSSTVLPYATIVAELFGDNTDFPYPVVESGGSSAGLKKFCKGVGLNTVDIANASRPIKDGELAACAAAGVTGVIEIRIGYEGIVFASAFAGKDFAFTAADWYDALAARVLRDGKLVANPNLTWDQIRRDLPAQPILAFIPGTKHGTREVFEEKVIARGCRDSGALAAFAAETGDEDKAEAACLMLRGDGRSVDIDGDYTETLARIQSAPHGIGVFGLSFYDNNTDKLKVASFGGVVPATATIASGEYPVSRPLFIYVKQQHFGLVPGLKEFAEFFVSDQIAGSGGPLAAYGLVSDPDLAATQRAVANEVTISR
ncbi:substrate-binding domain-containing protein [Paracoccus sp. (in: a-proteobacteria)]|uniref:substrate-binding domain-containing protein n=1 Tax=Paracoccus sp. TaxID=267 RepID=UPI0032205A17